MTDLQVPDGTSTEKDPVCGMDVSPATSSGPFMYHDRDFWFCCPSCADKFKADPDKYLSGRPEEHSQDRGMYTCPMHAEVEKVGHGSCPKCGMALESKRAQMPGSVAA